MLGSCLGAQHARQPLVSAMPAQMAVAKYLWLGSSPSPDESSTGRHLKTHSNRVRYGQAHPKQPLPASGRPPMSLAAMLGFDGAGSTQTRGGTLIPVHRKSGRRAMTGPNLLYSPTDEVVPREVTFSVTVARNTRLPPLAGRNCKRSKNHDLHTREDPGAG